MDNKFKLDLALLSKELKLLLELLKEENNENIQRNKTELFSGIDWDHFLHLARHHRVYPLMYVRLKNMEESLVPNEVIGNLYRDYKRNTFQMLQLSAEMEQLSNIFTENGIQLLFLKGPVIAYDIYGDISLRTSKDLDILVKYKDVEKAEKLLLKLGYKGEEIPTVLNDRKWRRHHEVYFHPEKRIQIELHWRMHPFPVKSPSFNQLWNRKRSSSLTSYPVFFLGMEDLLGYLIVHGARHGWFRLRWLKDIDQIIRKDECLAEDYELLRRYNYHFASEQTFSLVYQLLNTPIREKMGKWPEEKHIEKLVRKSYLYISNYEHKQCDKEYLDLLKTQWQNLFENIILLYPSYTDMKMMRLPEYLHFLYFPLRPFLWAWRKTKQLVSS